MYTGFAEIRRCPVYHSCKYFTPKCTVTKRRDSICPPVSTHDFEDVSICEVWRSKEGSLGPAQQAGAAAGSLALENGSGKEGEPKASGAERDRAGNIDHAAITVNRSKARRWWILDHPSANFARSLTVETALVRMAHYTLLSTWSRT